LKSTLRNIRSKFWCTGWVIAICDLAKTKQLSFSKENLS